MSASIDGIWEAARAFMGSRVILTAVELGVFTALADGARSSEDVAATLGTDPRATDRLMNALVVQGLLTKKNGRFRNSQAAEESLVPDRPGYAADGLMHTAHLWHTWTHLTEAVRTGTAPVREEATGPNRSNAFIAAMHHNAKTRASLIVDAVGVSGVNRLLDVGGGSADYSMAFCRASEGLTATVFDLPDICPITQGYIDRAGMADRVDTYAGDYLKDEFPTGFDAALLLAVIHSNNPEQIQGIFGRTYRALKPGGRIVVGDWFMDDERVNPPGGAIFALNMLVGTEAGDTYTESETTEWLLEAGFADVHRTDLLGGATSLLIATK